MPRHASGDRNFPFFYAHPDEPAWSSFGMAVPTQPKESLYLSTHHYAFTIIPQFYR